MPQDFKPKDEVPPAAPGSEADAEPCRTSPLVPSFSVCLMKETICPHALSFGNQYLCRHPDHAGFAATANRRSKADGNTDPSHR